MDRDDPVFRELYGGISHLNTELRALYRRWGYLDVAWSEAFEREFKMTLLDMASRIDTLANFAWGVKRKVDDLAGQESDAPTTNREWRFARVTREEALAEQGLKDREVQQGSQRI